MGFLNKFLRQFNAEPAKKGEERLDDDLRKLLKRLPQSTKRNLLQELESEGGSARSVPQAAMDKNARRASSPIFAPISETAPQEEIAREITAKEYAMTLMEVDDLPEMKHVKALHKALKKADEGWITSFRESGGMGGIYKAMAELAQSREDYMENDGDDTNEHEVPEEEVQLEEELVHCVMILLNKPQGLMTLEDSSDGLPLLAGSAIDSSSNYVRCSLLKLLTIFAESGPSGFETVMNALDHVKVDKDEDLRFSILVEAFGDADSSGVALVTDLIVFFNTILSSAFEFEERVMLRTEMISAGILDAMMRIRDYFGLSKSDDEELTEDGDHSRRGSISSDSSLSTLVLDAALESETNDLAAQMDLFDTVMHEDMKDANEVMAQGKDGVGGGGGEEGEGESDIGEGPVVEFLPDTLAVASIRAAMDQLDGHKEACALVEVIVANMEAMARQKCDLKYWKKMREASSAAFEAHFMESDDEDDGDDEMPAPVPAPASRGPPLPPRPTPPPPFNTGAIPVAPAALSGGASIPAPPPLPGMPAAGAIPAPPALPGMPPARAIPPPPALPGMPTAGAIPAPPALPGMPVAGAIPAPPALPGMPVAGAIPAPPALPGMPAARAIPAPPALPGMPAARAIPAPPALPGMPTAGAIPAPPALPGMPAAGAIPAPPALPGMPRPGGIPAPPALPGMGGIPAPPALPGMGGIPAPPALPGMRGIPAPPALPGMGGIPTPPALPGAGGLPRAPPLPGMGGAPMPPPLPGMGGAPRALPLGLPLPRGPLPPPMPAKPKGPKRRPVHWDKIAPTKLEKTVFNEIDPSTVDLPMDLLAEAFAEKPKVKQATAKDGAGEDAAAAAKKKAAAKVELLDAKTLRNNGIVFKRFRTKPHELRDSLVAMDLDKFDTDKLIALRGISPSPDDLPTLKGFDGDLEKLDEVSLFMVLTARIPRYQARLDCALFMKGFANDADFLSEKLSLVNIAVQEVVDSPRLKRLIEVVLAMGNYLNEGTRNGEARAIKLASLLKLDTVKTMDKKKTLLHVLMGWAKDKEPDLLKLDEDLIRASEASQWSLTDLKQQVTQLSKGFTLMQAQLKMAKGGVTKLEGDKFADIVEPFLEGAKDRMESLEEEYTRAQEEYDSAAKRFGEDPTKTTSGDFFSLVSSLVDMIAVALRDNELSAKAEERRKKREAQEKKRREAKAKKELEAAASAARPGGAGGRGGRGGIGMQSMRRSIRPSSHGFGVAGRGLGPAAGGGGSSKRPLGLGVNEAMLNRRALIVVGPDDDEESDDGFWDDEEGTVADEYERIKTQRVNEAVMLKKISKLKDPTKREIARGQLPYQKSTIGRQSSMTRQRSGMGGEGGSPALFRQVSAVRQASNLRAMTAVRQASTVGRGFSKKSSILRPSNPGGGMSRRGGLSTGRLQSRRMPDGPPGLQRGEQSADYGRNRRGELAADPRKQFKTLKSTAFLS